MNPPSLLPALPAPARMALLLDVDGTLLDFAATPDQVVVPPELLDHLRALRDRLDGALALISGRPAAEVAALLPDTATAIAGEHGATLRQAAGAPEQRASLPSPPAAWRAAASRLEAAHPGALLEAKPHGFVLHYRRAPSAGPAVGAALAALVAQDHAFTLVSARMAWELRPRGADKGTALAAVMALPRFAGRIPVFAGDDVTDQDAIAAARAAGGVGLYVPEVFTDARGVRTWLARLAAEGW